MKSDEGGEPLEPIHPDGGDPILEGAAGHTPRDGQRLHTRSRLIAVAVFALVVGIAVGVLVANAAIDTSVPRTVLPEGLPLAQLVDFLESSCASDTREVRVESTDGSFKAEYDCATVRNDPIAVRTDALARAARENEAERHADTVRAVERRLGVSFIPHDELVWQIGTGSPSPWCVALDREALLSQIDTAKAAGESVGHWIRVEAPQVAGRCPERLTDFYALLEGAGHAAAVDEVRGIIDDVLAD